MKKIWSLKQKIEAFIDIGSAHNMVECFHVARPTQIKYVVYYRRNYASVCVVYKGIVV